MFHKLPLDKHSDLRHPKNKTGEKNNKKIKKNKNDSPIAGKKTTDQQMKGKEEALGRENNVFVVDKCRSKSKQKAFNKFASQHPQNYSKDKTPNKKVNTTPIKPHKGEPLTCRKKSPQQKSKSRSPSTSRKTTVNMTQREYIQVSPLQNTKKQLFHTEKKPKSPSVLKPKHKQKDKKKANTSKSNTIKIVDYNHEDGPISVRLERHVAQPIEEISIEDGSRYLQSKAKPKREIPQIRTEFSGRKKSCIDDSLLSKIEQHHRSNKDFDFIDSCFLKSISEDTKAQQHRKEKPNVKEKKQIKLADIANFRQEQELKWSTMLEQIKKLKNQTQVSEKIDLLIQQITNNYNQLQLTALNPPKNQFIQMQQPLPHLESNIQPDTDRTYPLLIHQESQQSQHYLSSLVQHDSSPPVANICQEGSHSPRSNMISLDDFFLSSDKTNRLQKDLFRCQEPLILHNEIEEQEKSIDKFFPSIQQKKQDDNTIKKQIQNTVIPVVVKNNKDLQEISNQILYKTIDQFCFQLINNKKILHFFLRCLEQSVDECPPPPSRSQVAYLLQPSSNEHTYNLIQRLLDYLFRCHRDYTLKQTSFYYECKPLEVLRYVRSPQLEESQEEEDLSYEIQNEQELEIPFFNLAKIQEFETQELGNQQYLPSYFTFNMCVYDAFNEIIDKIRPYGTKGKSIFTLQLSHGPTTESQIRQEIFRQLQRVFSHEIDGEFLGDDLAHGQEGNFQILYFASMEVMQCIYNEAVTELYRIMKKNKFQL